MWSHIHVSKKDHWCRPALLPLPSVDSNISTSASIVFVTSYSRSTMMFTHVCMCIIYKANERKKRTVYYTTFISLQWHYDECDGVWNHQRLDCLLNHLSRRRLKKTTKPRVIGLVEGNPQMTGGFPWQNASSAENVSICCCHHVILLR